MLPSVARYAIATYTAPGDLVLDPMAGIGTTTVEAVHLGRDAIGVEYERRWAALAAANLEHAAAHGATGKGEIIRGDARQLPDLLPDHLHGHIGLVLTSPPYGSSTHGHVREYGGRGGRVAKVNHRYGDDQRNLAHVSHDQLADGFTRILAGCVPLLKPDGYVVVTARPYRRRGRLVDIAGMVVTAGSAAGLRLVERCPALIAAVRDRRVIPRASFFQLRNVRAALAQGDPQWLPQHETALVFQVGHIRRPSTQTTPNLRTAPADDGLDPSIPPRMDRRPHPAHPAAPQPGSATEFRPHRGRDIERTTDPCPPNRRPRPGAEQPTTTGHRRHAAPATPPPPADSPDPAGPQ
jgi:hypothetical protein